MLEVKINDNWYKVEYLLDGKHIWCPGIVCGGRDELICDECPYHTTAGTGKYGEQEITRGEIENEDRE